MIVYTQTAAGQMINVIGQFMDALLSIYFLHKFFAVRKEKREYGWIWAVIGMTAATQVVDYLFDNNMFTWILTLFLFPFLYTVLFEKGNLMMKLLVSTLPCTILISIENLGVAVTGLADWLFGLTYPMFLALYIFRRIVLKLALLYAIEFFLNYSIYDSYHRFRRYWYLLGGVDIIELFVLYWFRGPVGDLESRILGLMVNVFCFLVPLLFYYVIYQTDENLKKFQVMISQKNYIDTQEQYMQQLISMQDSLRKFRHDYKTHLFCIDQLLMEKSYEEAHNYLKKIHDMGENMDNLAVYTADRRLNMLLNQISQQARGRGITLTISALQATVERIPVCDLNVLLANLSSNAMEAAQYTEEKKVEIKIEKNRAYLQIMVTNSANGNPLRDNPRMTTSKDDKELHGFGLPIIRSIVEKYQGMIQMDSKEGTMKIDVLLLDE